MQVGERWYGVKATLYALQIVVAEFGGRGEGWRMTVSRKRESASNTGNWKGRK